MVKIVPMVSPAMIVTANPTQKTSGSSGMTPSTVVAAARNTGRRRDSAASTTESKGALPAARLALTSSSSTMAFLTIMPARLMAPSNATKPNGVRVASRPAVMPTMENGMVSMMIAAGRMALNRPTMISSMMPTAGTTPGSSEACDFAEVSNSPPHTIWNPGGSACANASNCGATLCR